MLNGDKIRDGSDGGGGRMTQRCALRPSGRCLRQRFLADARIEPSHPSRTERYKALCLAGIRYATGVMVVGEGFEHSKSMTPDLLTATSAPARTPAGVFPLLRKPVRWWWGKDYSSLRSSPYGPLPLATFSRFRSSRTLIEGSHPSPTSADFCIAHRVNYIAVVNNGGGGRIRTFEVDDGRFTVCSLWPLGNPTTG